MKTFGGGLLLVSIALNPWALLGAITVVTGIVFTITLTSLFQWWSLTRKIGE